MSSPDGSGMPPESREALPPPVLISLGSTVALARALDRLPRRLVVLAVSGSEFGFGQELTPPVGAAVPPVIARACELMGRNAD
jgi:Ni,Fe-hydrogenase maturation factor